MISEESFKIFATLIRFGNWSSFFPYTWNPVTYTVEVLPPSQLSRWRVFAVAGLILVWVLLWSGVVGLRQPGAGLGDVLYFLLPVIATLSCTLFQTYNLTRPAEFAALISSMHLFS